MDVIGVLAPKLNAFHGGIIICTLPNNVAWAVRDLVKSRMSKALNVLDEVLIVLRNSLADEDVRQSLYEPYHCVVVFYRSNFTENIPDFLSNYT